MTVTVGNLRRQIYPGEWAVGVEDVIGIRTISAKLFAVSRIYRSEPSARILLGMDQSFKGKVVVVTGANSGIGETAGMLFAKAQATVYGIARRKEAIEESKRRHPELHWVLADVSNSKAVEA